jgi:hypothetical protein
LAAADVRVFDFFSIETRFDLASAFTPRLALPGATDFPRAGVKRTRFGFGRFASDRCARFSLFEDLAKIARLRDDWDVRLAAPFREN